MATASGHGTSQPRGARLAGRRKLLAGILGAPLVAMSTSSKAVAGASGDWTHLPRKKITALLVSATTVAGKASLEHAWEELRHLYADFSKVLLINFASLPGDRDAYAARMQRDFSRIDKKFDVQSLHAVAREEARKLVRDAEAVFVSGGNTFLLLRELYDRDVVALLQERVLSGMPYAGSSAGSNIAGIEIGTTNDFPITDVPTIRSLGIMGGVYNPHHPDLEEKSAFGSRQWKIRQYASYNPEKAVIGVNNAGMIRVRGDQLTLRGDGSMATVQLGEKSGIVEDVSEGSISNLITKLSIDK